MRVRRALPALWPVSIVEVETRATVRVMERLIDRESARRLIQLQHEQAVFIAVSGDKKVISLVGNVARPGEKNMFGPSMPNVSRNIDPLSHSLFV